MCLNRHSDIKAAGDVLVTINKSNYYFFLLKTAISSLQNIPAIVNAQTIKMLTTDSIL